MAAWLAWGPGLDLADLLLAEAFYVITGLGVTIGFHRLLAHRGFTAVPALLAALAVAGSMSFEGEVIGRVATHRRHHAFADRPGDPNSPDCRPAEALEEAGFLDVGAHANDTTPTVGHDSELS
jgi:stearoyl-CoA desaturase (Delta-9 desaturase)